MEIVTNFLYQIFFTVGVIVVLGLLIALCRRAFCSIVGVHGPKILLITGVVGTPIHELSHALMCLIFGHKITEIKLYDPDNETGTLGYVNHSFRPKNLYHQIGNFFIGIAPIVCGSGVLLLLMFLLIPEVCAGVMAELQTVSLLTNNLADPYTYVEYLELFWNVLTELFDFANMADVRWWIFLVLALLISSHMELSLADIRGSLVGLLYIAGILLILDTILYLISLSALEAVTSALAYFSTYIISFLAISGIFSLLMVLIALAIKGISALVSR